MKFLCSSKINLLLFGFVVGLVVAAGLGPGICFGSDGVAPVADAGASRYAAQDVIIRSRATKICQLVGDWDRERGEPTINLTDHLYDLYGTDLGASFRHKDRTYIIFGDAWKIVFGDIWYRNDDPIAYTTDTSPEDGLELTFLHNGPDPDGYGPYRPIKIPGVNLGAFNVPIEGVSIGGKMYIYAITDYSHTGITDRSVVAVSDDDGYTFTYLYDLSREHFIHVSIVETDLSAFDGLPESSGVGLVMFGLSGYAESSARLAFQPAAEVESPSSIRYFMGLGDNDEPLWSSNEADAIGLFNRPCVRGELTISYNRFIKKWIILDKCCCEESLRGINMRTADNPWGPWSEPQIIFHPWDDGGYCHFMHVDWNYMNCDSIHEPGRAYQWGFEYGPYQFEDLAVGDCFTTTIYFTMSTSNPYTVVLMSATLERIVEEPLCTFPDFNGDGKIDFKDFSILALYWLQDESLVDIAPFPGDHMVDYKDVAIFSEYWLAYSKAPPAPASNPDPADGATDIDINADLSWTADVDATSHDVYFGTNPAPGPDEFQRNQTETTFDPGTIAYHTTYYWRIDEVGPYGKTTGTVWSFTTTTGPPPP